MFRAFVFANGVFAALCGGLLFYVERVELTDYAAQKVRQVASKAAEGQPNLDVAGVRLSYAIHRVESASPHEAAEPQEKMKQVIDPPDWAAFCLLSIGAVTVLYSLAIPGRRIEDDDDEDE